MSNNNQPYNANEQVIVNQAKRTHKETDSFRAAGFGGAQSLASPGRHAKLTLRLYGAPVVLKHIEYQHRDPQQTIGPAQQNNAVVARLLGCRMRQ